MRNTHVTHAMYYVMGKMNLIHIYGRITSPTSHAKIMPQTHVTMRSVGLNM